MSESRRLFVRHLPAPTALPYGFIHESLAADISPTMLAEMADEFLPRPTFPITPAEAERRHREPQRC